MSNNMSYNVVCQILFLISKKILVSSLKGLFLLKKWPIKALSIAKYDRFIHYLNMLLKSDYHSDVLNKEGSMKFWIIDPWAIRDP